MFRSKSLLSVLSLFLTLALILSACSGGSKSPKDALQSAMEKSAEIKSYGLNGSLKIQDLKLPPEVMAEEGAAGALGLLQNAELSWTGAYRADPMLVELNMKVTISGDLAMSFQLPMVMTQEKMWIKVPNIPMLGLPEEVVGKFVEFDLKKLAEEQGTEWPADFNVGNTVKLSNDIYGIVFKHVDEKTYLSKPKAKDAGIPEDKKLKDIVQLHVTKDQVEPFVTTVVKNIAPEVIDLLSKNEEYRKMLQLEQSDLDDAKKELAEVKDQDIKDGLADFNKEVKSLDTTVNIGINDKGFASYTDMTLRAEIESEGQTGSGTIKVVSEMTDINGDPKFEYAEPKGDDVISMDKLNEIMGGLFGGTDDFGGESLEGFDDGSATTDEGL
ncbi:hypothetical protein J19TS2_60380 [Cohnella xylanilytica]|uniref:hypothetical protein n=1 Tax=Cohnella xylanilytica TaxID=557555 RepID=UPI001B13DBE2|nr:hypothetical protein [Cohnella xylanilytica]GIO16483.1 hypothetical protein J19TS2_60380 [Cohnella xylanilytica]